MAQAFEEFTTQSTVIGVGTWHETVQNLITPWEQRTPQEGGRKAMNNRVLSASWTQAAFQEDWIWGSSPGEETAQLEMPGLCES